ncbi:MAG: hypothetical protein ETSY2_44060 [Candidatus Entotheonella gemina]|uniref:ThuA-like domain-containing protein n=1 Tax=Candidatus Entotheonella gemina TaxID=1429439 RepID=W4LIB7_9BACT|nr:MAG: hypothetical protein ETSY2_44060 [Candidatus Entotheonella gemina]
MIRVHVVTGGFPPGSNAGHDMDYARLRLLQLLQEQPGMLTTVANNFNDIQTWLPGSRLLMTYVAGPFLTDAQSDYVQQWLDDGGRWLALHGTSGGKAARLENGRRKMVKTRHHEALGSFFLNHPPLSKFQVRVTDASHPLTRGLPASFEVVDELYLIELQDPATSHILLTTELARDPSPAGFGFSYDEDTSVLPDGVTRVLGYTRSQGKGGVAYIALGHCHSRSTNRQPVVDPSVSATGDVPLKFRGAWESEPFEQLLRNGIKWGSGQE